MWSRRAILGSLAAGLAGPAVGAGYADAVAAAYGARIDIREAMRAAHQEARRLQARADRRLRGLGLAAGSVAMRLQALARDPAQAFADSEAGRAEAVALMNARLEALRPRLATAFGDLAIPQPEVRRPRRADEARGGYREPPVYYVDLRNIRARPRWTLPSVAFHETVPGHALDGAVAGGRRSAAFSEAWATYAEQLAFDLGAYDGDPEGELGYLQWRLFRMGRIIADIGQAVEGWSVDRAVATVRDLQGFDIAFVTIEADVRRMRAQPGVCAAQGVGALAIAQARPKRRGDWPAFHRAILADGLPAFAMVRGRGAGRTGR